MRRNFWEWLKEATSNITINISKVEAAFRKLVQDLEYHDLESRNMAERFNVPQFTQQLQQGFANYPGLPSLLEALKSQDYQTIWNAYRAVEKYMSELEKVGGSAQRWENYRKLEPQRKLGRQILDYLRCLDYFQGKPLFDPTQYEENIAELLEQSKRNMEVIRGEVAAAVNRIGNWNDSSIMIDADPAEDERGPISEASDGAHIAVGQGEYLPEFMYFKDENGKVIIDDVIEGADEDFFQTPQVKSDYFALINELRNPGSTSQGRVLTLYTARPTKDRNMYLTSTTLPINVFLTNDYQHASGLAHDLGSHEVRDIWRVRIDSRFLTQTLDGPVKYYQVTTPNAEARSINLVDPGE